MCNPPITTYTTQSLPHQRWREVEIISIENVKVQEVVDWRHASRRGVKCQLPLLNSAVYVCTTSVSGAESGHDRIL